MEDMTDEQKALYKEKLIQLLGKFNDFCTENKLTYFAAYGTVIGAVRHKGLIPWDDDIDVYMMREDYERFKCLQVEAEKFGCGIEKYENIGFNAMFSKFVDNTTTLWEIEEQPYCIGVYIDVFPLDEVPNDRQLISKEIKMLNRYFKAYLRIHYKTSISGIYKCLKEKDWISALCLFLNILRTGFDEKKVHRKFTDIEKGLAKYKGGEMLMMFLSVGPNNLYKKEWFSSQLWVEFEGLKIPIPIGYDAYLGQFYGDYMKYPPLEEQVSKHYHTYVNFERKMTIEEIRMIMNKG